MAREKKIKITVNQLLEFGYMMYTAGYNAQFVKPTKTKREKKK